MDEAMPKMKFKRKRSIWKLLMCYALVLVLSALGVFILVTTVKNETRRQTVSELEAQYEERIEQERQSIEQSLKAEYGYDKVDEQISETEAEARAIAKVLYPMKYNSEAGLKSVVWCVINRVESSMYPNTVEEVCSQDKQWMGWSEENPVIESLYELALEQLEIWHDGSTRPMDNSYLFLDWNSEEITLRTTFEIKRGTHYWYEDDWN